MPPSFEDELNDYVNSSQPIRDTPLSEAVAPDTSLSASSNLHRQLPSGYEISADPQYAYNQSAGLWLDTYTGTVSYYDPDTLAYIPVQAEERPEPTTFDGAVRLVVVQSSCYAVGQVVDINVAEGLDIGRDRAEGDARRLRIPDIEVSRFHAKIYAGSSANTPNQSHEYDLAGDGSEDGEIEEPDGAGATKTLAEDELSDGECHDVDAESTESGVRIKLPKLFIVDQGSTHGTFVNGGRLSEAKTASRPSHLQHMDRIDIGQTTLQLHIHEQWVCAKCKNSGNNEINTYEYNPAASGRGGAQAQSSHTSDRGSNLQKARIDNLKAIKSKYMDQPARETKPASYVDRAMLRRQILGNYQHPVRQSPPTTQVTGGQPLDSQAPEPITDRNPGYSMLKKMGWAPGAGLGASKEGIVNPIEIEGNADRVGLGAVEELPSEKKRSKVTRVTKERFYNL